MLNMAPRSIPVVRVRRGTRTRYIGLRLRDVDAQRLEALAKKEGVGISTFARLILEAYVQRHGQGERP